MFVYHHSETPSAIRRINKNVIFINENIQKHVTEM